MPAGILLPAADLVGVVAAQPSGEVADFTGPASPNRIIQHVPQVDPHPSATAGQQAGELRRVRLGFGQPGRQNFLARGPGQESDVTLVTVIIPGDRTILSGYRAAWVNSLSGKCPRRIPRLAAAGQAKRQTVCARIGSSRPSATAPGACPSAARSAAAVSNDSNPLGVRAHSGSIPPGASSSS